MNCTKNTGYSPCMVHVWFNYSSCTVYVQFMYSSNKMFVQFNLFAVYIPLTAPNSTVFTLCQCIMTIKYIVNLSSHLFL